MEDDNDNGNENRNYHELVMNVRRERQRERNENINYHELVTNVRLIHKNGKKIIF
jgi:hypothetical protein